MGIRKVALSQGRSRKRTNSAAAARETAVIGRQLASRRTASAIANGASTPVAMIIKKAIPWIQPLQVSG
jgi:hypothetical protein